MTQPEEVKEPEPKGNQVEGTGNQEATQEAQAIVTQPEERSFYGTFPTRAGVRPTLPAPPCPRNCQQPKPRLCPATRARLESPPTFPAVCGPVPTPAFRPQPFPHLQPVLSPLVAAEAYPLEPVRSVARQSSFRAAFPKQQAPPQTPLTGPPPIFRPGRAGRAV